MKKIQLRKRKQESNQSPSRITNETVAEHREQVLAGGRRFKYPRQIARHKLVLNAIIISTISLLMLTLITWWQLYPAQNTGTFFYRLTRIVPVPVASVDGNQVRYSDYLMLLSGSKHYLEQTERLNLDSDDGKRQVEFMKRQALDGAVADTYAAKYASDNDISISDAEVQRVIDSSLNTVSGKISQDVYDDSTLSTLGYTASEYRHIIKRSLLRQEVSYSIDETATAAKSETERFLSSSKKPTVQSLSDALKKKGFEVQLGSSGLVPKTNHDGGLSQAAYQLEEGALSQVVRSTNGDGYYILQLVSKSSTQLNYNFVKIPLLEFSKRLATLAKKDSIREYIDVKQTSTTTIQRQ